MVLFEASRPACARSPVAVNGVETFTCCIPFGSGIIGRRRLSGRIYVRSGESAVGGIREESRT